MLHFDCSFESGNLDRAVMKDQFEYDIYPRTDANTRGHNYWFYFLVKTPWHPDRVKKYKDYGFFKGDDFSEVDSIIVKFNIFKAIDTKGLRI
jgi:hypothetical protein